MKIINTLKINLIQKGMIVLVLFALMASGCEKYLNIPIPTGQIAGDAIWSSNATAGSVLSGIYTNMVTGAYASGSSGTGYTTSLYADELANINPSNTGIQAYYTNQLISSNVPIWTPVYKDIYSTNAAIQGLTGSTATLTNKNQYLGEAYFCRAWLYFNLVNLFGDVPLTLTTDYKINNGMSRTPQAQVNALIISDLKNAESLLATDYRDANGVVTAVKARPNKLAAQALLARVYLYQKQWADAEAKANAVIGNTSLKLTLPAQTFLAASTETIWGLTPVGTGFVSDWGIYNNGMPSTIPAGKTITSYGPNVVLSNSALAAFESNDARFINWVRQTVDPSTNQTYNFPNKYKSNTNGVESLVILRLAEQYLIRAEARAMQNNVQGAQADINVIRTRANLGATTATDQTSLLAAIVKERRDELFSEQGMRFFDLKRTGTIDAVMNAVAPSKGAVWNPQLAVWPVPNSEILADPNLKQNPGYN